MDIIFIQDFRAKTRIGIYPWERIVAQTLQFDLEIGIPNLRSGQTDLITDTINYADIVQMIHEILNRNNFLLLEALAEHVAQKIMHEFNAPWVKIRIAKLDIIRNVRKIGVCIERGDKQSKNT
ncbi:MAG: dihydroneopterin aldolase [Nitrosomonas sp.]|nr:dihydroneopterin aldolase [Nitrosomonas sp.]